VRRLSWCCLKEIPRTLQPPISHDFVTVCRGEALVVWDCETVQRPGLLSGEFQLANRLHGAHGPVGCCSPSSSTPAASRRRGAVSTCLVPFAGLFAGLKLVGLRPAKCPAKSLAKKKSNSDSQVLPAHFSDFGLAIL